MIAVAAVAFGAVFGPSAEAAIVGDVIVEIDPGEPTDPNRHPMIYIEDWIDGEYGKGDEPGPKEVAWGTVQIDLSEYDDIDTWWVWKTIHNGSDQPWFDLHIDLLVGGLPSPESDGISFGQMISDPPPPPVVDPDWSPEFVDWTGNTSSEPDALWMRGRPPVEPGRSIHIKFPLTGTNFRPVFQLAQHATTPEPTSVALAVMGGLGVICLARRRNQR